ncbi:26S proteasome non-ATPase regulatory subunit 13 homolog B-like protein [Tanacetum coccineum]
MQDSPVSWLYHLLEAFNSGDLIRFQNLCLVHREFLSVQPALVENENKFLEKCHILCLMDIIYSRPSQDRTISLSLIANRTKLSVKDAEYLLLKSLSKARLGLLALWKHINRPWLTYQTHHPNLYWRMSITPLHHMINRVEAQKTANVTPTSQITFQSTFNYDHVLSPQTPPRSPGLDLSEDENTEVVFVAKLDQLKIAETVKMCRKVMSARAKKSANVLNKKSKKMSLPSRQNHSRSSDRLSIKTPQSSVIWLPLVFTEWSAYGYHVIAIALSLMEAYCQSVQPEQTTSQITDSLLKIGKTTTAISDNIGRVYPMLKHLTMVGLDK